MHERHILTLSCKDARGIVAAVTTFLADNFGFIIESAQFGDASTGQFFMRVEFALEQGASDTQALEKKFEVALAQRFGMQWQMVPKARKSRVLVMVSRYGHCLNDIIYRYSTAQLPIEIPAIVSNHEDWRHVAQWHDIPFHYLPVDKSALSHEHALLEIIAREKIDVVVLARYMQILSPELCKKLAGKAINIHHSFLPSFKGAKPYQQAFDRGVKLIGATAHYVTDALDEGPIIEQEIARVDHAHQPDDLAAIGHDIECVVLARALKYVSEHRVLLNGQKTVVFR